MKNITLLLGISALILSFAQGAAQAQMKAPAKSSSKAPLGSGLALPSAPQEEAPAAPATPAPVEDDRPLDAVVQDIADCIMPNLPKDWVAARVEVIELGRDGRQREFEGKYTYVGIEGKELPFTPCDLREPAVNVYKLNRALEPAKRNWIKATLILTSAGKFDLKYDYAQAAAESAEHKSGEKAPESAPTPPSKSGKAVKKK